MLYETYLPGEAEPVHAAWATALGSAAGTGLEEIRRLGDVALHLEGAGDLAGCFDASIAAADAVSDDLISPGGGDASAAGVALWSRVESSAVGRLDEGGLLERTALACARVGRSSDALVAGERALALATVAGEARRSAG